ncbi:MAG TPA: single-stranded DNA-binding protein [Tenuifilaceae bacterium]|jgi:single-strand DNA-binding protein|nr:single-stranded DNA-binding protein [Tenuifilaceae bacterium]HPX06120.1 single-stranded DNA-binding protein [Tenuifilaceae bacterium]HQB77295.1 single-stranded DNA-binding protein [Tenuifilaceae bacterium]
MSVNKVILVGNVGKDPDVRHLDNGATVASFPLATNETYTDKSGNKQTLTEWHNVVVWRGLADIAEKYVKKGSLLFVEGRIRTRSYDDKDGNKRYITEIDAQNFRFLGPPPGASAGDSGSQSREAYAPVAASAPEAPMPEPDDLPF